MAKPQPRKHHAFDAVIPTESTTSEQASTALDPRTTSEQVNNSTTVGVATDTTVPVEGATAVPVNSSTGAQESTATISVPDWESMELVDEALPSVDPTDTDLSRVQEELAVERARVATMQEELKARSSAENEELAALRKLRAEMEADKLMSLDGVEFETLDTESAREIVDKVVKPITMRLQQQFDDRLTMTTAELKKEQERRREVEKSMSDAEKAKALSQINAKVLSAHPDFEKFKKTKAFASFMNTPAHQGSNMTMGALIAHEYHNGNAEFIVSALNQFKNTVPQGLEAVASVAMSSVATTTPSSSNDDSQKIDLEELNNKRITGKISRNEYHTLLKQYREQNAVA